MRALVIFESMFGNTQEVARAVARGLQESMTTDLVEVGAAPTVFGADVSLLVVGGPTHAFGLSRPSTREDAAQRTGRDLVSTGIGLREWLSSIDRAPSRIAAATFDTKANRPRLPGSAARAAHKRLRWLRFQTIAAPESFYITDMTGPLVDGELDRAYRWGEALGSTLASGNHPAGAGSP
jgi:hypothetical protein